MHPLAARRSPLPGDSRDILAANAACLLDVPPTKPALRSPSPSIPCSAVRLAEEFRAERNRVRRGWAVGRARRYKWSADWQAILEATLAAARIRLAEVKAETGGRP